MDRLHRAVVGASATPGPTPARRVLYPETEPFSFGWLPTGSAHEVYYEECGRPDGEPCVILHGGPGGAVNPTMRRFFDPDRWRMMLFDQRGCGRSRPNAVLTDNDTWALVEDIERLRRKAGVEKWTVFGGSWGSTLALAYAVTHPERVQALVLRGVFLLTKAELAWFYQGGAAMLYPDAWERFLAPIPAAEHDDLIGAYHRRLTGPRPRRARRLPPTPGAGGRATPSPSAAPTRAPPSSTRRSSRSPSRASKATTSRTAASSSTTAGCWSRRTAWQDIPGWIVQGRFDVVTPMTAAWALHKAWPQARFELVWDAGHASTEPGVVDALVRATDAALG